MTELQKTVSPIRLMFSRSYGPFFIGNLLSNLGTWFQNIALVLLVFRLTESTLLVGVVNFTQFSAVLLLAPYAGVAADRFDRRRLLMMTESSAALVTGALAIVTYVDLISVPIIIGFALATSVANALSVPASNALVPSLVTRDELPTAVALMAVTFSLARAIGPILGVVVVSSWGFSASFAINSLSYLAFVLTLLSLRPGITDRLVGARPRIAESFRLVKSEVVLTAAVICVGIASLSADPVNTLTPAFSTDIFKRPDTFTGFLVGAFGAGAVSAAFVVTRWQPSFKVLRVTLLLMFAGMLGFAMSSSQWTGLAALFVGGFGYLSSVTTATSILHLVLEDAHRGRVAALWSLSFKGVRPIGSLVDGFIASFMGLRMAAVVMAIPTLMGSIWIALWHRRSNRPGASV